MINKTELLQFIPILIMDWSHAFKSAFRQSAFQTEFYNKIKIMKSEISMASIKSVIADLMSERKSDFNNNWEFVNFYSIIERKFS